MVKRRDAVPANVRQQAIKMLASGKVTLPEMAGLLGVSTHMLWNWCRLAKVDWRKARNGVIAAEWRRVSNS
jgi:transposase-like protein